LNGIQAEFESGVGNCTLRGTDIKVLNSYGFDCVSLCLSSQWNPEFSTDRVIL
jgi:hypothetical protein